MTCTDQCSICLEELKASTGMLNECKHLFCYDCIKKWSEAKRTCPLDRTPFDTINILHEIGGPVVKEEKLGPRMVNRLDSFFDDDDDDVDDYEVFADTSRLVMDSLSPHHMCHGCLGGVSESRMIRCRGCDLPFHMECLIGTDHGTYPYMCSFCQPRRAIPIWRAILRSIKSFFMNRLRAFT